MSAAEKNLNDSMSNLTNLNIYSTEDLILTSLKSEIDSRSSYLKIRDSVKNAILKDKMDFLAREEDKHRSFFEVLYKRKYPNKSINVPEKSPVPLPEIKIKEETMALSEVLQQAMEAEVAAHDFYLESSKRFKEDKDIFNMLLYIADMELGHYRLLEIEKENSLRFESYEDSWPMMHVGP
ncbi:MAG: Rubrerythrin [Candidatus Methanofastidiosum methylothiophilum]|uniref:Rubrerythrin n=1 Tax=Candidatus Methanofastidiosum methylothiophilum TaxID=1705564 RepID=A0A150J1V0_9EURY|nr:MAG: Rubrerythrin [Candidatus Methanofastidiosum methylthiophilus]KYC46566.1 MAG: Rubrerythrin [Candidatus Methanofastidiosum methylthiophilus]KYC51088.1 MAG: Rubrerythrin [Candidatus Methanofastidiosum methylthiophilus]